MAKSKKQERVFYEKTFTTPGVVVDDGKTILMADGSVFKRTVIPAEFSKRHYNQDPDLDVLEEDDNNGVISEVDAE